MPFIGSFCTGLVVYAFIYKGGESLFRERELFVKSVVLDGLLQWRAW